MKRALVLVSLLTVSCGGGGGGGGGFVPTTGGGTPGGGGGGAGAGYNGQPPVQLAVITSAQNVVGTGTPASVTQAALQAALTNGGTIVFDAGGPVTLSLTSELTVTKSATIEGSQTVTIDGGGQNRIFNQSSGTTLQLQDLTLQNGHASDKGGAVFVNGGHLVAINVIFKDCSGAATGPDIGGGAVYELLSPNCTYSGCTFTGCTGSNGGAIGSLGCDLVVFNCSFTGNQATGNGPNNGGIGGAIYMDGVSQAGTNHVFTCTGCTFSTNTAESHGGAVFAYFYAGTSSTSTILNTTFDSNTVQNTGGLGLAGAVYHQNETLNVIGSTFSNNTCPQQGGGLWLIAGNTATISNCTFWKNSATTQGQALGGGVVVSSGPASLIDVTIAENSAGNFGGGLFAGGNTVTLTNALFWNNTGTQPYNGLNANQTMIDGGGNMQWPATRANGTTDTLVAASAKVVDAQLQALAQNGGPTETCALPSGSPAIKAGVSGGPSTDQRGTARGSPPCIGAYEAP